MTLDEPARRPPTRRRRALLVAGAAVGLVAIVAGGLIWLGDARETWRTTPVHDPPVLAGRTFMPWCSGGYYVRGGDTLYLTAAGHCAPDGFEVVGADGALVGVFGPALATEPCPHPGKVCRPTDIALVRLAPAAIPWGHLNEVDMGAGGYRVLEPGSIALACDGIRVDDEVEINGRDHFRSGNVVEKGENLHDGDGDYFPCMIAADIRVQTGDSGGAVLVNGQPAGTISRSFRGYLGFTPLAEGLEALGLELCTDPLCGLTPP